MRPLALTAVGLALVFAAPAQATHGTNVFSGAWLTNTGDVSFAVANEADAKPALQSLGGVPCSPPTVYYQGYYYDTANQGSGAIAACTQGSSTHLVGRYVLNGSSSTHGDGSIDINFSAPSSFTGFYTGDNFPGMTFDYTGSFQAHLDGDGCCPGEGSQEPEEPPPSQQQVNECSSGGLASIAQAEEDEYCYIITTGPARGEVARGKIPRVGPKVRELGGEIHFVDDNGDRGGPAWVAVEAKLTQASQLCYMLQFGGIDTPVLAEKDFGRVSKIAGGFAGCADATARILARYDQILQKRRAGAGAAARGCASRLLRKRGQRRVKPKLRVTCRLTATGVSLTIRPRRSGQTLRRALGGRRPKLFVGRSKLSPPGHVQTVAVWTAKQ